MGRVANGTNQSYEGIAVEVTAGGQTNVYYGDGSQEWSLKAFGSMPQETFVAKVRFSFNRHNINVDVQKMPSLGDRIDTATIRVLKV